VTRLLLTFAPGSSGVQRPPKPDAPLDDTGAVLAYLRSVGDGGVGQPVRVTGMVMTSGALEPGEFAILRYAIVPCLAHPRPLPLLLVAAPPITMPPDQSAHID